MPTISVFFGISVRLYFKDNTRHHKPHIHAQYGEYEAAIALDGEILDGSFPKRQLTLVLAWVAIHEDELYENWNKAVRGEMPSPIDPLR